MNEIRKKIFFSHFRHFWPIFTVFCVFSGTFRFFFSEEDNSLNFDPIPLKFLEVLP